MGPFGSDQSRHVDDFCAKKCNQHHEPESAIYVHIYPPRPCASKRVDVVTQQQTFETSQNLQTNLLGGGFTLPTPSQTPRLTPPLLFLTPWPS